MEPITVPADAVTQIVTFLLSFGLPGFFILLLSFGYWRKDNRCDELSDTSTEVAKEYAKVISENTASINALRELILLGNGTGRRARSSNSE